MACLQDKGRGRIRFVDISADDYNPKRNMGITYDDAMSTIHAIRPNGEVSGEGTSYH
jgi:DNA relaxase NicK